MLNSHKSAEECISYVGHYNLVIVQDPFFVLKVSIVTTLKD